MRSSGKSESLYKKKGMINAISYALEGVVHTLKSERNMRVHFLLGFLVLIAGIYFNLQAIEFMLLCFAVTFVLVAEMFNTAVEHAMDLVKKEQDPVIKIIKDIAAGAVFVTAINASVVGYILLSKRISWFVDEAFFIIKQSSWHITLIALITVVGLVLLIKILLREKDLLRGGMPSGHSAVAFAAWVIITLISKNALVSLLVFFMALLIARSRKVTGIHSLWEILAGSTLGALVALLAFQLLS